jgi:hypothetical protein
VGPRKKLTKPRKSPGGRINGEIVSVSPQTDNSVCESGAIESMVVYQLNLQHAKLAMNEMAITFSKISIFIALLQEPYTVKNKIVGLPPTIAKFHSEELHFKASICCSKYLQVFPVPQFTDQLVVTCVWHTEGQYSEMSI